MPVGYVVNWMEMEEILNNLFHSFNYNSNTIPFDYKYNFNHSVFCDIPALRGEYNVFTWTPNEDIIITDIIFAQSGWKAEDYGNLSMYKNGFEFPMFKNIYTKEGAQEEQIDVIYIIPANTEIRCTLHNVSGSSRQLGFDVYYLQKNP